MLNGDFMVPEVFSVRTKRFQKVEAALATGQKRNLFGGDMKGIRLARWAGVGLRGPQ